MTSTHHRLAKYLARYAEPEASADALESIRESYRHAMVVPLFDEDIGFLHGFREALSSASGRVLCIAVVNAPDRAATPLVERHRQLVAALRGSPSRQLPARTPLSWTRRAECDLLIVERFEGEHTLPHRQAVGLARKIGSDIAVRLMQNQRIESPWLFQCDADAHLPAAYFDVEDDDTCAALHLPFRHVASSEPAQFDAALFEATLLYEISLRYQVLGLGWAGSPYAWHALGSCLVIRASSYAAVRGFPKRAAGEDFHVLRKLSKVAPISNPPAPEIRLSARSSHRVPFGTGPSVVRLLTTPFELPSPESFAALRHWLGWLNKASPDELSGAEFLNQVPIVNGEREIWKAWLRDIDLDGFGVTARRQRLTNPVLRRRCSTWFDALMIQQLLHRFRQCYPPEPAERALERAPFLPEPKWRGRRTSQELLELRDQLARAEANLPRHRGPTLPPPSTDSTSPTASGTP